MSSRGIPHLHVDEEIRVFALILIDVDADTMSHANQGQKSGPDGSCGFQKIECMLLYTRKGYQNGLQ